MASVFCIDRKFVQFLKSKRNYCSFLFNVSFHCDRASYNETLKTCDEKLYITTIKLTLIFVSHEMNKHKTLNCILSIIEACWFAHVCLVYAWSNDTLLWYVSCNRTTVLFYMCTCKQIHKRPLGRRYILELFLLLAA